MALTKYGDAEKPKVLPPEEQQRIGTELGRLGKTSARDLTEVERQKVFSQDE